MSSSRVSRHAPWALLLALSFLFRLPPLVNAADLNSDVAIVGLQAMHIERGEWSPLLLGSTYQTSVDSTLAALAFAIFGPSPRVLELTALALHVVLTWLVYDLLAHRLGSRAKAAWLAALLVFTSAAIHSYALYPPRQASLTLIFAGIWVLDRAPEMKRTLLAFTIGGALVLFACFADPYAMVLAPPAGLLALLAACDSKAEDPSRRKPSSRVSSRIVAAVLGALLGGAPLLALLTSPSSRHGEVSTSLDLIPHNAKLLLETCGPWALSTKVYRAAHMMDYVPWTPEPGVAIAQRLAAALFLAGIATGALYIFTPRVPWAVRRLGLVGALALAVNVGGFLVSRMVMDHFSMRYLAASLLFAPLALAPLASHLRTWGIAAWLAPYLVSSAIGGWVAYGPDVDGIALRPSSAPEDYRLGARLREMGVREGVADYWTAYRFTFLLREDPIVVPSHSAQDRYAPYRARVAAASRFAYIVDPLRSDEPVSVVAARIGASFAPSQVTRIEEGRLTAFVVDGRASSAMLP